MKQEIRSVDQVLAGIQALDLDCIKLKLMDAEEGQGWSREYAEQMEVAYRRFLTLMAKYPEETIAPTKDVDKFWHGHILDTMKYAEDCERVFGYFLHHFPYFGMRGEEDAKNQALAADAMHTLYEREFGEPLPGGAATFCAKAGPAFCAKAEAAFCAKAAPAFCAKAGPAFCAKASPAFCAKAKPAFCAKASPAFCAKASPAFCAKANVNANVRPALPAAA